MIAWREKFRAMALHFLVTLAMAAAAAAVIFLVWFPDPFQAMLGGVKFFVLISVVDLVLGPLISLVIYNSKKPRRELIIDYTIVGIVQIAAFIYGIVAIEQARPVYIAFVVDRFEVVRAGDLSDEDLAAAKDPYRTLPMAGPVLIGTEFPTDPKLKDELLMSAIGGKDIHRYPSYYAPYATSQEKIKKQAQPLEVLYKRRPEAKQMVADAHLKLPESELRWVPILGKTFWTVLLDANGGPPLAYLPIDPYSS
jgi:hypothetical protein